MKKKNSVGFVDEYGKYIKGEDKPMPSGIDNQFKSWSHAIQRKEHAKDIIQPHIGQDPNRDFIQAYDGEVAEKYFTKEQIRKAERSLS